MDRRTDGRAIAIADMQSAIYAIAIARPSVRPAIYADAR